MPSYGACCCGGEICTDNIIAIECLDPNCIYYEDSFCYALEGAWACPPPEPDGELPEYVNSIHGVVVGGFMNAELELNTYGGSVIGGNEGEIRYAAQDFQLIRNPYFERDDISEFYLPAAYAGRGGEITLDTTADNLVRNSDAEDIANDSYTGNGEWVAALHPNAVQPNYWSPGFNGFGSGWAEGTAHLGYHAYWTNSTDLSAKHGVECHTDEYCMEMNDDNEQFSEATVGEENWDSSWTFDNLQGRWLGISHQVIGSVGASTTWSGLGIEPGTEVTVSWYQMVSDIVKPGWVGMHHKINGGWGSCGSCCNTFEDGGSTTGMFIQTFHNSAPWEWERQSFSFTVGDNWVTDTSTCSAGPYGAVYFYGHGGDNSEVEGTSIWYDDAQLEIGRFNNELVIKRWGEDATDDSGYLKLKSTNVDSFTMDGSANFELSLRVANEPSDDPTCRIYGIGYPETTHTGDDNSNGQVRPYYICDDLPMVADNVREGTIGFQHDFDSNGTLDFSILPYFSGGPGYRSMMFDYISLVRKPEDYGKFRFIHPTGEMVWQTSTSRINEPYEVDTEAGTTSGLEGGDTNTSELEAYLMFVGGDETRFDMMGTPSYNSTFVIAYWDGNNWTYDSNAGYNAGRTFPLIVTDSIIAQVFREDNTVFGIGEIIPYFGSIDDYYNQIVVHKNPTIPWYMIGRSSTYPENETDTDPPLSISGELITCENPNLDYNSYESTPNPGDLRFETSYGYGNALDTGTYFINHSGIYSGWDDLPVARDILLEGSLGEDNFGEITLGNRIMFEVGNNCFTWNDDYGSNYEYQADHIPNNANNFWRDYNPNESHHRPIFLELFSDDENDPTHFIVRRVYGNSDTDGAWPFHSDDDGIFEIAYCYENGCPGTRNYDNPLLVKFLNFGSFSRGGAKSGQDWKGPESNYYMHGDESTGGNADWYGHHIGANTFCRDKYGTDAVNYVVQEQSHGLDATALNYSCIGVGNTYYSWQSRNFICGQSSYSFAGSLWAVCEDGIGNRETVWMNHWTCAGNCEFGADTEAACNSIAVLQEGPQQVVHLVESGQRWDNTDYFGSIITEITCLPLSPEEIVPVEPIDIDVFEFACDSMVMIDSTGIIETLSETCDEDMSNYYIEGGSCLPYLENGNGPSEAFCADWDTNAPTPQIGCGFQSLAWNFAGNEEGGCEWLLPGENRSIYAFCVSIQGGTSYTPLHDEVVTCCSISDSATCISNEWCSWYENTPGGNVPNQSCAANSSNPGWYPDEPDWIYGFSGGYCGVVLSDSITWYYSNGDQACANVVNDAPIAEISMSETQRNP